MTKNTYRSPLLVGMKSIAERFEFPRDFFYVLLNIGLPVRKINGRWYGHERNIDEFLRAKLVGPPVTIEARYDPDCDDSDHEPSKRGPGKPHA